MSTVRATSHSETAAGRHRSLSAGRRADPAGRVHAVRNDIAQRINGLVAGLDAMTPVTPPDREEAKT